MSTWGIFWVCIFGYWTVSAAATTFLRYLIIVRLTAARCSAALL